MNHELNYLYIYGRPLLFPIYPSQNNPLLKLTVQIPDIWIGSAGYELAILDLVPIVKLKQKDHRD